MHGRRIIGSFENGLFFTRPVQDWEVEVVVSSFERLYSLQLRHERKIE
jgi:hypothetical protein